MKRVLVTGSEERIPFEDLDDLVSRPIRAAYDGSRVEVVEEPGESLTVESEERSTNLNNMVRRWLAGEPVPQARPMEFGDVSRVVDLQEAANELAKLKAAFMQYPADIRAEFRNDPLEFAAFVSDPANLEAGRELGIYAVEPAEPSKPPVEAAPAAPAGDKPA